MSFRITGLPAEHFCHLFGLPDEDLARMGVRRVIADKAPGFPDRIELRDASPGESVLLLNFVHQPADNPYRASHAIFVREGAATRYDRVDEVPEMMRVRLMSLRAFDAGDEMVEADVVEGQGLAGRIDEMLADPKVAYLHAHYAKRGCFAARIDRVGRRI